MIQKLNLEQAVALLNQHPVPCALFNGQGQPVWMHAGLAAVLQRPNVELSAMSLADVEGQLTPVPGDLVQTASGIYALVKDVIAVGGTSYQARYFLDARAQSDNKVLRERLEKEAMVDADTGLLTYSALIKNLDLLVTRSRRYGNPVSLLKIHVALDTGAVSAADLLTAVGHLLKDQLRWADLIGRTEDERFVIIMPETSDGAAQIIIDKIRERLKTLTVPYADGVPCGVRACYGLTAWRKGDDSTMVLNRLHDALTAADAGKGTDLVIK